MSNETFSTVIIVADDTANTPISGAQVFTAGASSGVTDEYGNLTIELPSEITYPISVKATGYQTEELSVVGGGTVHAYLQHSTAPLVTFYLHVNPEDDAEGSDFMLDGGSTTTYTIGGITFTGVTPGNHTITGTVDKYNPVSQSFDIGQGILSGTINLTAVTDTGLATQQQTQNVQDPNVTALLPTITPPNIPEFIAPNTNQGTYFTMTQARMYIGSMFIDELNSLQFALQDNKIPIFGYASRFYDSMAQGKSLVQGQLTINFISEGYLYTVMEDYLDKISTVEDAVDQIATQNQNRLLYLTNGLQNPDPAWTPAMIATAKAEVQKLAGSLGPNAITAANNQYWNNQQTLLDSTLGLAGGNFPNAVYKDVMFDIVIQYSGAGRTVTRRLENCWLISNESIMDHSGTPILDSYGFIARRLR